MVPAISALIGCMVAVGLHLMARGGNRSRLPGAGLIGFAASLCIGLAGWVGSGDPLPPVLGLLAALLWGAIIGVIKAAWRDEAAAQSTSAEGQE